MTYSSRVNTKGLERAQVLCALVNGTQPKGDGYLDRNAHAFMTYDDAQAIIDERKNTNNPFVDNFEEVRYVFRSVGGRPIYVDLIDEDGFDAENYDKEADVHGAAQCLITRLRVRVLKTGG